MRLAKILFISWIVLLVCILIIPKLLSSTDEKKTTPTNTSNEQLSKGSQVIAVIQEENEGPMEGNTKIGREKIQNVVKVFLNLINEGNLDDAGTMIDGNYLLDLMAKDRPANQGEYIRNYVHLFEPGDMLQAKVTPPTEISRNLSCKVEVQLKGERTLTVLMGLSEMVNDHDQEKLWYFTTIEKI